MADCVEEAVVLRVRLGVALLEGVALGVAVCVGDGVLETDVVAEEDKELPCDAVLVPVAVRLVEAV